MSNYVKVVVRKQLVQYLLPFAAQYFDKTYRNKSRTTLSMGLL